MIIWSFTLWKRWGRRRKAPRVNNLILREAQEGRRVKLAKLVTSGDQEEDFGEHSFRKGSRGGEMGEFSPPPPFSELLFNHADTQTSNTSTRFGFYYIITKIYPPPPSPPFQNPGSAPELVLYPNLKWSRGWVLFRTSSWLIVLHEVIFRQEIYQLVISRLVIFRLISG